MDGWLSGCFVRFQVQLLMSGVRKSKGRVMLTFEDKSLKHQAINSVCFRTNMNPKVMTIFSYSVIMNILIKKMNIKIKIRDHIFTACARKQTVKKICYQFLCNFAWNLILAMSSVCSLPAGRLWKESFHNRRANVSLQRVILWDVKMERKWCWEIKVCTNIFYAQYVQLCTISYIWRI